MCKFLSCISNGKGDLKFFDVKDIVDQMVIGNPKTYNWNSHTSICQYYEIDSRKEDLWNKWEYDPISKVLTTDNRPLGVKDDSEIIKPVLDNYFAGKNIDYLINLYGGNSGKKNSGYGNSGNHNSGHNNSGEMNSGKCNSGHNNSGHNNSGYNNSGDWNSGYNNSGDWNSGRWNSGNGILNTFCTTRQYVLFDEKCTREEYEETINLDYNWFKITKWIDADKMTDQEKSNNKLWASHKGYLKTIEYKDAWKKCPQEFIDKVKKLKNFCPVKFKEITGLDV